MFSRANALEEEQESDSDLEEGEWEAAAAAGGTHGLLANAEAPGGQL